MAIDRRPEAVVDVGRRSTEVRLPWIKAVPALLAQRQFDEADRILREVRKKFPNVADVYHWLVALALSDVTRSTQAIEWAQRAIELDGLNAERYWMLGRAFKINNLVDSASAAYRRAIALRPDYVEAWVSLGIALKSQDDLDGAIHCYQRAIEIEPQFALAHANLGNALLEKERRGQSEPAGTFPRKSAGFHEQQALDVQRKAVELDPENVEILVNYASVLQRTGDLSGATEFLNRAMSLDPTREDICIHFGAVLFKMGRYAAAEACYRQWLKLNPPTITVLANLAIILTETGDPETAMAYVEQARAIDSKLSVVDQAASSVAMRLCDIPEAIAASRRALERGVADLASWIALAFATNYIEENQDRVTAEHIALGQACLDTAMANADYAALPVISGARVRPSRLRLGFCSADFRQHSVAYFLEPLLQQLDRSRYEVILYYNNTMQDEVTERFRGLSDRWRDCALLSDPMFCRLVREDGVDILVDATGYTSGARPVAFAARCAPVQVVYLGYPTATGNPRMDFRISDPLIDPPTVIGQDTERVLRFPETMFCYAPPDWAPLPRLRPEHGSLRFGSFNNAAKISDHTLSLWGQVLARLPDARLLLKAASLGFETTREHLLRRAAQYGLSADRIELNPWFEHSENHLDLYNEIDVALDCYPYNGATTTCEALWMGVPVVTRSGHTHVSRMGASILGAAGYPGWVTQNDSQFVERAVELAQDIDFRNRFRRTARMRLQGSSLLDFTRQTRSFAALLEEAWACRSS